VVRPREEKIAELMGVQEDHRRRLIATRADRLARLVEENAPPAVIFSEVRMLCEAAEAHARATEEKRS
jgi:hypothetical protein